jgi:hypothetical protein
MMIVVTVNSQGKDIVVITNLMRRLSGDYLSPGSIVEAHPMLPCWSHPDEKSEQHDMNLFSLRDKNGIPLPDCSWVGNSISLSENLFGKGNGWQLWVNGVACMDLK